MITLMASITQGDRPQWREQSLNRFCILADALIIYAQDTADVPADALRVNPPDDMVIKAKDMRGVLEIMKHDNSPKNLVNTDPVADEREAQHSIREAEHQRRFDEEHAPRLKAVSDSIKSQEAHEHQRHLDDIDMAERKAKRAELNPWDQLAALPFTTPKVWFGLNLSDKYRSSDGEYWGKLSNLHLHTNSRLTCKYAFLAGPKPQDKVMLGKVSEAYNKRLYPICTSRLTNRLLNSEISSLFAEEMHKISLEEDGYQILDWVFKMYIPSRIIRVRPKTLHLLN